MDAEFYIRWFLAGKSKDEVLLIMLKTIDIVDEALSESDRRELRERIALKLHANRVLELSQQKHGR